MFPNSFNNFNNVNPNHIPMQYPPPNQNQYSYFNPYQTQQPMMPNMQTMPEQQYYMQPQPMQPMQPIQPMQPMQPMYFPYMQQQQPMYNPMFIPQNPQMMPNNNMYHQNQRHGQHNKQQNHNQNQRRPHQQHQQHHQQQQQPQKPVKIRNEVDPNKPEHTKEEILKWIEQRKRNFPSKANIARKELEKKLKEETGEIVEPALSILESKLRRRIRVLGMIDGKANRKKEFEKNYLLKCVTNPYKKLKTTTLGHPSAEDKEEKEEKGEEEQAETQKVVEENKEKEENKNMYDAFKEFQMQINQIEDEKPEDGEVKEGDDDEPVERKIITEKHLEKRISENNKGEKPGKIEKPVDKKGKRVLPKNLKKTPKPVSTEPEGEKKTESIEDIIANLRQRKEKDDQEFSKVLEGTANTADFKYRSNTLLANLLIDTIYQEKNVILQCLRYIVREDFFDKPQ